MKKALFAIDTPIQIINILEAIRVYEISEYDVLICDGGGADEYTQIKALKNELNAENTWFVPFVSGGIEGRIAAYAQHLSELRKREYDLVFFTNIRQHWQRDIVCSLKLAKIVLMDDGNSSTVFHKAVFSAGRIFDFPADTDSTRVSVSQNVRQKFNISVEEPDKLELFTSFNLAPLPWLSVTENPLVTLQKKHSQVDDNTVLILGTGVIKQSIAQEDDYVELVRNCVARFPDKRVIYQPHRTTPDSCLMKIRERCHIDIQRLNMPVEKWLYHHTNPPAIVCGFHSMAVTIAARCFPNLKVIKLEPNMDFWRGAKTSPVWNLTTVDNYQIIQIINDAMKQDSNINEIINITIDNT